MRICVYGASSSSVDRKYIDAGERLGREMARRGHSLVFGGGAAGMMGAAARGVREGGGAVLGIAPRFFDREGVLFRDCTEFIFTDTMAQRKQLMEDNSDAFIVTPGGIGTFEEFYQVLTLNQLGQMAKPIGLLNVDGYLDALNAVLERAIEENFMRPVCRELYRFSADAGELLDYIESTHSEPVDMWAMKG